jgi:muramidase (phage lysozyme)
MPLSSDVLTPAPPGFWGSPLRSRLALTVAAVLLMLLLLWIWRPTFLLPGTRPLVLQGGDPYLRALMRTISASESNVLRPYNVLHGGEYVGSLERHPNRCEAIGQGPNRGDCSTAAGRYQLLYGTWQQLAVRHHPARRAGQEDASGLSFSPADQDAVVLGWLSDPRAWGVDLSGQLRRGQVAGVLRRLSRTWTSLGYGIENNSMSRSLPRIYQDVLRDELEQAALPAKAPVKPLQKDNKKAAPS